MPKDKASNGGKQTNTMQTQRPRPAQSATMREDQTATKGRHKLLWIVLLTAVVALVFGALGAFILERYFIDDLIAAHLVDNKEDGVIMREVQPVSVIEEDAVVDVVSKVNPAVVSIVVTDQAKNFVGQPLQQTASGTGFILTEDGLIATNAHVITASNNASFTVITQEGERFEAQVLDTDPLNDFAIVKIEASGLPVVDLGSSDQLKAGEKVIAIGNALGEYQNTVTTGIVSATNRSILAAGAGNRTSRLEGLIQVDAAINAGNSGGPLLNITGQVIGINTAVDAGAENIGFAIPINDLRPAIDSVIEEGRIIRPLLGVRYIPITSEIAALNDLPVEDGALVFCRRWCAGSYSKHPSCKGGDSRRGYHHAY